MEDIVGSGEPVIVCGDREIEFVDGELDGRFRPLPGDRAVGGFLLRDAVATDGETTFRVVGSVRFKGTEDSFRIRTHLVLIGPRGDVETVRTLERYGADGEFSVQERGSCTLQFDQDMPEEEMP